VTSAVATVTVRCWPPQPPKVPGPLVRRIGCRDSALRHGRAAADRRRAAVAAFYPARHRSVLMRSGITSGTRRRQRPPGTGAAPRPGSVERAPRWSARSSALRRGLGVDG